MNIKVTSNDSTLSSTSQAKSSNESTSSDANENLSPFDFLSTLLMQANVDAAPLPDDIGGEQPQGQGEQEQFVDSIQEDKNEQIATNALLSRYPELNMGQADYVAKSASYLGHMQTNAPAQSDGEPSTSALIDHAQRVDLSPKESIDTVQPVDKQMNAVRTQQLERQLNALAMNERDAASTDEQALSAADINALPADDSGKVIKQTDVSRVDSAHKSAISGLMDKNPSKLAIDGVQEVAAAPQDSLPAQQEAVSEPKQLAADMIASETNSSALDKTNATDSTKSLLTATPNDYRFTVELPSDIAGTAKTVEAGSYEINLKIYPPDLGRLTANITFKEGRATLKIITESEHDSQMVSSNLQQLRDQFSDHQIDLVNIDVSSSHSQDRGGQEAEQLQAQAQKGEDNQSVKGKKKAKANKDQLLDAYI